MLKTNLWIVTPCYYDVPSFLKLKSDILNCLQNRPEFSPRFVVIDDSAGLDTRTSELSASDIQIVRPPFNLGHQRGIVYGLREIEGKVQASDIVITMDSDGEDRAVDLPQLIDALQNAPSKEKIVLARRTKRKVSIKFRMMYLVFVLLFRTLTGKMLRSGNFACFPGHTLKKMISHPFFDLCYSSTLVNIKIPVTSVACERGPRYFDQSKMGYFSLIMHGFRMLMPFVDHIAMRAIIVSSLISAICVIAAVVATVMKISGFMVISNLYFLALGLGFVLSILFLGIFLLLFTVFVQLQSSVLTKIDE